MSADQQRDPQGVANALEIAFADEDYETAEEAAQLALSMARKGKQGDLDDE